MLQVRDFFQCPVDQLMFYAVRPGTALHPHRDMSGNLPFGRLLFHVPIVTHPEVDFLDLRALARRVGDGSGRR